MTLTIRFLGLELLHIELAQPADTEAIDGEALSGGTVASIPISMTWTNVEGMARPEWPYEE